MAFTPRSFEQILDTMIAHIKANTDFTDFEVGSAIRTILEAASLEDDEQYFQIVQLLDAFNIQNATGNVLKRRVADFGIDPLQPSSSSVKVNITDLLLITTFLTTDIVAGAVTLPVEDTTQFPTPTFNVRIGESTVAAEVVSCTVVSPTSLTVSATVNPHSVGDRVSVVTGAADRAISPGQQIQVPAIGDASPIKFVTTDAGTLVNGNFLSTPIDAKATVPGVAGNVGVGEISQFTSTPPFSGAGVTNSSPAGGGRDLETDPQLKDRYRAKIQSLTRGTVLALKQAALGVVDPVTGQRVVTSNILEDNILEEVVVYIDDGTGFTPDTIALSVSELTVAVLAPTVSLTITDATTFPGSGFIILSPEDSTQIELVQYTSVNYTTNVLTLSSATTKLHNIGDEVLLVDVLDASAEPGDTFLQTTNFPIVRSSDKLWVNSGGGFQLQVAGTDYFLNRGTGQVELSIGLPSGSSVVMNYTYYTNLISTVQKVINGSIDDPVNFGGFRSAGIVAVVENPIIHRVSVRMLLTAAPGFKTTDLAPLVREAVEAYISGLGIGNNVIRAAIIDKAMNISGVADINIISPTSNVTILQNELPVPFDSNGDSLITVT